MAQENGQRVTTLGLIQQHREMCPRVSPSLPQAMQCLPAPALGLQWLWASLALSPCWNGAPVALERSGR